MKQMVNGDLLFDKRDIIPSDEEMEKRGYSVEENDPRLYRLHYLPCVHREIGQYGLSKCGRRKLHRDYCLLKQIIVNPLSCRDCEVRQE